MKGKKKKKTLLFSCNQKTKEHYYYFWKVIKKLIGPQILNVRAYTSASMSF